MIMTSCITHPDHIRLVIILKWQIKFCYGNRCAADLLSFFECWHSWKLETNKLSEGILNKNCEKCVAKATKLPEGTTGHLIYRNSASQS